MYIVIYMNIVIYFILIYYSEHKQFNGQFAHCKYTVNYCTLTNIDLLDMQRWQKVNLQKKKKKNTLQP